MEWNDEKQARLDALRAAELTGALDQAGQTELDALIKSLEAEEQARLSAALTQIRSEQTALRRQIQESEDGNEQLAILAAQMERLLIDGRQVLHDLQRRHQSIRETYQDVTGEPLSAIA